MIFNSYMKFLFIFIILIWSFTEVVIAQTQCALSLSEAEDKYDQGRLYEIPEIINSCLEKGFSKEEEIRAYRLLTLTYLFLDYYDKADKSYLELLKLSPEFKTNDELDPQEIINHHAKFTTKPKYYLTLGKIGVNFSTANVLLDYSLSQIGSDKYSSLVGFQVGLGGEMVLYKNLHLASEIFISQKNIHFFDNQWDDFLLTNLDIKHTEIELPIMLKYNFPREKISPFAMLGVSPGFLVGSTIQNIKGNYRLEGTDEQPEDEIFPVQPRPEIKTTEMKNRFNYSVLFGGGINYKIGLNYLVFEARYSLGMLNVTDINNRMRVDISTGRELKFPIGYVDDDFKINNLSFIVGFVRPLYKPRKIK